MIRALAAPLKSYRLRSSENPEESRDPIAIDERLFDYAGLARLARRRRSRLKSWARGAAVTYPASFPRRGEQVPGERARLQGPGTRSAARSGEERTRAELPSRKARKDKNEAAEAPAEPRETVDNKAGVHEE